MRRFFCSAIVTSVVCGACFALHADEAPQQNPSDAAQVGPKTEDRFPPLNVPDGFQATLFACDPLVEYPSVIALGPRSGSVFAAHDYLTGLGVEIVRRDEIRLIEDTDGDGYADRSTKYAEKFNSIQGLAFHDGSVYVMHAPLLTQLRDTNDDGIADERRDLIRGLGLPPEENNNRLHCANGVVAGHDGWLYLALGDRGCDVQRPEGDRLLFQQGGILRCRSDGTSLHVFSTGLRNIYDVVLDDELNVFVRDNENDGGDYMIRVCHCFSGSDHGYPYHYYERPEEPMPPLADLGRGSSAGGTSYLETAFPSPYRDSLFFCEWGRGVVRYTRSRRGSSFEPMVETDFATGSQNDPYGFKPTDLVVDYDGSMLVSDWCDGQRPKRGRGRIYRISYSAPPVRGPETTTRQASCETAVLIRQLDSPSYHHRVRAQLAIQKCGMVAVSKVISALNTHQLGRHSRLHAVWIIANTAQDSVPQVLFDLAASDPDAVIRAQAIRAIGDLTDPMLIHRQLRTERGDEDVATRVASFAERSDPCVMLEALSVMRRLKWSATPKWVASHLSAQDPVLRHAAQQALRNALNWPAVTRLLDKTPGLRQLALQAVAEQRVTYLADQLIARLQQDENPEHRREYADALTRIVRKPEPWTYWGFRPGPRPAATVDWEKTIPIETALNTCLNDTDFDVRAFVLHRMIREGVRPEIPFLANWLRNDTSDRHVIAILKALSARDFDAFESILTDTVIRRDLSPASRLAALSMLVNTLTDHADVLLRLVPKLDDGPVMAAVLSEFGERPGLPADELLIQKLDSDISAVRVEAIQSLTKRGNKVLAGRVGYFLEDTNPDVRLAAAEAAGELDVVDVKETLLAFTAGSDQNLIATSLDALRQLQDSRALPGATDALRHRISQRAAVEYLRIFGSENQIDAVVQAAAQNPASGFQQLAVETLAAWHNRFKISHVRTEHAIASVHGESGQPLFWYICGPLPETTVDPLMEKLKHSRHPPTEMSGIAGVSTIMGQGIPAALNLTTSVKADVDSVWIALTPVHVDSSTQIEILTSATGDLKIWVNGEKQFAREERAKYQPDSDRFPTVLKSGTNFLAAEIRPGRHDPARFQLRFRRRSSKVEHERLVAYALKNPGDARRGRIIFTDTDKSTCIRCHRLGQDGGRIGPDLTGIGSRFSRIHLIESILEPNRSVAPSYSTLVVAMKDGNVLSGIRVSQSNQILVLGDNQGKLHQIDIQNVEETSDQAVSTMPEGLEKKLTEREFTDLIAFLESEKSLREK